MPLLTGCDRDLVKPQRSGALARRSQVLLYLAGPQGIVETTPRLPIEGTSLEP